MPCLIPVDVFYEHIDCFLPVGYRFRPTDEELINHFLRRHVLGYRDDPCIIPETPFVHKFDPWHLPRLFRERSIVRSKEAEWWFLSRLLFKTQKNSKYDRQTPSGHWKTTGQEKKINAKSTNRLIGTMRNLVFIENEGSSAKETVWVMHEYCLHDNYGANFLDQKFVLCRLINKRDEFIDDSTSVEAGSISLLMNLGNDKAWSNIPENIIEATMDQLAEALCPPMNLNLSSNPHLVDMGAPSHVHIANDNLDQSDQQGDVVDGIETDGSIDDILDAIDWNMDEICQQRSGTEPETDNGQGWGLPADRPIEQGEHADRLRQPTIRLVDDRPREETSIHAQDNSQEQNIDHIFMIQPIEEYPEINCLTHAPVPTRASRGRDRVQLHNGHGLASKAKVTGLVENYGEINCLACEPVTIQASRGRDRVHLQNKPSVRLVSKESKGEKDKAAANISKNVFSMRELKACLEQTQEIEQSSKSKSSVFPASSAKSPIMAPDKCSQGSVSSANSNRTKHFKSKSFQTEAKPNRKVKPSSKTR
ncbi:uncharacterized protein LOC104419846 isoform X2 [Eucalyptus grandis]|uniref:uncharacterized protein LOC104419846 isoform X2 n=1 Tax=Eucalyptus grandis TaxID=71139 RepID=UPI00192E961B|nr:uncharacterized protein LOC104419846 isoform X2 [Eucalyptus grandis]